MLDCIVLCSPKKQRKETKKRCSSCSLLVVFDSFLRLTTLIRSISHTKHTRYRFYIYTYDLTQPKQTETMMRIFIFLSSITAIANAITCATYATTDILDSVTRTCVDDFDAIQAGSGAVSPCLQNCGDDVEFCLLSTNRESGLNTARCGDTYVQTFGTCTEKVCICVSRKDSNNVGKCNSGSRAFVSTFVSLLLVAVSGFLLM